MKKFFCGFVMLLSSFAVFSQNANPGNFQKMIDFLPPAPNAAEIIKHSQLSVNKNTGSPSIGIPLFTLKGTKLSTGVSLSYNSTGIKVDEIASRVGIGWAINAGGVVTRTVRGVPDESNTRVAPPLQFGEDCGTYSFLDKAASSLYDAEPDLFNFSMNGISGSFVFDHNMQPVLIPAEKYAIQYNFSISAAWNFKIITTDGIAYYFGSPSATEKTKRENSCGKSYDQYLATSWYLIKIEHPNAEVINFTYTPLLYGYDNGVNQTANWAFGPPTRLNSYVTCQGGCPPALAGTTCFNQVKTDGVLLSSITSNNGSITFQYASRQDCTDKLISSVSQFAGTQLLSKFDFTYNQQQADLSYQNENASGNNVTPYLTDLTEYSSDLQTTKSHRFGYKDPGTRPPRLSFSQDHWGYFNGRRNFSFLPRPDNVTQRERFPQATANREADEAFASRGILTKIIYPTGGIDNLEYESNRMQSVAGSQYRTEHEFNCSVTGTGTGPWTNVVKTFTFTLDNQNTIELLINSIDNTGIGNYEPIHNYSTVSITKSSGGPTIFNETFAVGTTNTRYAYPQWTLEPATYTLTYEARGAAVTTNVKMKFTPVTSTSSSINMIVGGVRVKRITTSNPGGVPMIKRYYYGEPGHLEESSIYQVMSPVYRKDYWNSMQCQIQMPGSPNSSPGQAYCQLNSMYATSLTNLFTYGSSNISYASVVESTGENFEGGGIYSKFYVGPDYLGQVAWGHDILNAPLTNGSKILNGVLNEQTILKKDGAGNLIPIKKSKYNYIIDSRVQKILSGYTVNQAYHNYLVTPSYNCAPSTWVEPEVINAYDAVRYDIFSYWTHPDYITETLYDQNGQNPVITTTNNFYENDQHLQLTKTEQLNSKNQLIRSSNTYPHNYVGNPVYDAMIAKNIITPVVESKSEIVTSPTTSLPLAAEKTNYGNTGNNNFSPVSVQKSGRSNIPETEGTVDSYDAKGNILQFTNKAGISTAIIWGYNSQYPVAQVAGATYATAIAQLTGGTVTNLQTMDGATLQAELHRIRTGLPNATVITYTYKPSVGVTSITDANNKTNSYEYDAFNRLVYVKDQDGNYLKKNEYNYAASNPLSSSAIYFNAERNLNIQCLNCIYGFAGNFLQYTIPYGKYFSLISQADAELQADADASGQEYANKNGLCKNAISCTGEGYRVVNCACILGTKVCEGAPVNNGNGTYTVTYHYWWPDNTTGPTTTEIISCSGPDKKVINCTCETGARVCDGAPVNNGNGTYTVSYHYRWSDNSTSSVITETISCSGLDKKIINCGCETGMKIYLSSVYDKKGNMGCAATQWLCTYRYRWSDGSFSTNYTECSGADCGPY